MSIGNTASREALSRPTARIHSIVAAETAGALLDSLSLGLLGFSTTSPTGLRVIRM